MLCPRDADSCCPDGRRGGGGGGRKKKEEGGSSQGHGNLQEDSHGPAAAEHAAPGLSDKPPALLQAPFVHTRQAVFSLHFPFFPSCPHLPILPKPTVGRTWAGEAAPWLGRTETPAEGRRGKSKWTTSRRYSILKKSSAREYTRLRSTSRQTPPWCSDE